MSPSCSGSKTKRSRALRLPRTWAATELHSVAKLFSPWRFGSASCDCRLFLWAALRLSTSHTIACPDKFVNERRIGRDFEGSACSLVEVLFQCLRPRTEEKREKPQCVGFEVLAAVIMKSSVFFGYNALWCVESQPTFRRSTSLPSSESKNKRSKKSA
jgi:hypothetical protein